MNPATASRRSPAARMMSSRVRRVMAVRRPPMDKKEPLMAVMEPLVAKKMTVAERESPKMKKMTYSEDSARNIEPGHYCNNDQSETDRVKIQRTCNRAPTTVKGGMRKKFYCESATESLVRKIVARCRDRRYGDIGTGRA